MRPRVCAVMHVCVYARVCMDACMCASRQASVLLFTVESRPTACAHVCWLTPIGFCMSLTFLMFYGCVSADLKGKGPFAPDHIPFTLTFTSGGKHVLCMSLYFFFFLLCHTLILDSLQHQQTFFFKLQRFDRIAVVFVRFLSSFFFFNFSWQRPG